MAKKYTLLEKCYRIDEFRTTLENITHDDKRDASDYKLYELFYEAEYLLSTFSEGGHINNDSLNCDDPAERRDLRNQQRALKKLVVELKAAVEKEFDNNAALKVA